MTIEEYLINLTQGYKTALELGCMFGHKIGLLNHIPCRVGVEAYGPYLLKAVSDEVIYINRTAQEMFASFMPVDCVLMIDFIEHLDDYDANNILYDVNRICKKRSIIFVPDGPNPQDTDSTGMGGDHWQMHRSTWDVARLRNHGYDPVVWENWHRKGLNAILAVKDYQ